MEDEAIISLYFERSESAIAETDKKYGGLCRSVADRILGSRQDSEECVQDAYLGVWNAIPPSRPNDLRAFVLKITRNISLSRLRKKLAKKRGADLEVSLDELGAVLPDKSICPDAEDSRIADAINEFLGGLDPCSRAVFMRKYWFFDSVGEIAKRFGFSEPKVKSSLFRTREKLRKFLEERGIRI